MLKGLLLKESLHNQAILAALRVTKTETWQIQNAAPGQPAVWTALSFEADDSQADLLAENLSQSLKPAGWFINASTDTSVYVIFPGRVFKYIKGAAGQRAAARQYGLLLDIPERQLDWEE